MASTMMESLFQRTMDDLVKGLRLQMIGESRYLAKALEEVRKEIKSTDPIIKVTALQKLTYLQMASGADMSWASFHIVEVMTLTKFSHKKVGYLAASQSFHEGTDVLVLTTNLLRKDMGSKNEYEISMAIECLSRILNPDLAAALTSEVFTLMASSRSFIRKKATLVLLRVFLRYPEAIRVAFKRLLEKMDDADPQVVCAAVSVLCELTLKDPRAYLNLAPDFYRLLEKSSNNWLSIKLVKIFGALTQIEPRLGRKIAGPLCDHMRKTNAKSLLFECIRTVTLGLLDHEGAVKLCVEKLRENMGLGDPNLKYLGLKALAALMDSHPWALTESKEVIIKCLSDGDIIIQRRALVLIMGMVSENNVEETVQVLLRYAQSADASFCNELVSSILQTCSRARYELVSDFGWYVSVLADIARIPHGEHGDEVGRQLVDIALRVESVRTDVVKASRGLLLDPALLGRPALQGVLCAAAWIVGEFIERAPLGPFEILEALLQPRTRLLPFSVHAVYLQGVLKVFVSYANQHTSLKKTEQESTTSHAAMKGGSLRAAVELIKANVAPLVNSVDMEVQERACNVLGLLQPFEDFNDADQVQAGFGTLAALSEVFSLELGPVSVHAQGRVQLPDGLSTEDNLDALGPMDSSDDVLLHTGDVRSSTTYREWEAEFNFQAPSKEDPSGVNSSAALLQQHRHRHESFYLPSDTASLDYPPPQLTPSAATAEAAPQSLTESSIFNGNPLVRSMPRQAKARRPVVVALDDEDDLPGVSAPVSKKGLKDELVFSAIRKALSADGNKDHDAADGLEISPLGEPSSRKSRHSRRSAKNKEKTSVGVGVGLGNEDVSQVPEVGKKEHRRSRHHRPSRHEILVVKTNKDGSSSENENEGTFELSEKTHKTKQKHRSSHRHSQRSGKSPVSAPQNTDPIPDFLL
ncbi:hypothetical protein KC19_10G147100 [Ceratodon purpureus]|uniref:AP-3 complex subunit delta n=1 Tax=Ceratodon purpureus TaxID=3225 RepID=A0A8T0GP16_CERPU|nr:hypothetical protein KC19_10G147100 [Ceratodon purpureus]